MPIPPPGLAPGSFLGSSLGSSFGGGAVVGGRPRGGGGGWPADPGGWTRARARRGLPPPKRDGSPWRALFVGSLRVRTPAGRPPVKSGRGRMAPPLCPRRPQPPPNRLGLNPPGSPVPGGARRPGLCAWHPITPPPQIAYPSIGRTVRGSQEKSCGERPTATDRARPLAGDVLQHGVVRLAARPSESPSSACLHRRAVPSESLAASPRRPTPRARPSLRRPSPHGRSDR